MRYDVAVLAGLLSMLLGCVPPTSPPLPEDELCHASTLAFKRLGRPPQASSCGSIASSPAAPAALPPTKPAEQTLPKAAKPVTKPKAEKFKPTKPHISQGRVRYPFIPGSSYMIPTTPLKITDIVLQPGETIRTAKGGDSVQWVVDKAQSGSGTQNRSHIALKPKRTHKATNLVIYTDVRTYYLELISYPKTYVHRVEWDYPYEPKTNHPKSAIPGQLAQSGLHTPGKPFNLNFSYEIRPKRKRRPPPWTPTAVYDDGTRTFIVFHELGTTDAPVLYLLNDRKELQIVNYRQHDNTFIVDRLFDAAELRLASHKRTTSVRIFKRKRQPAIE